MCFKQPTRPFIGTHLGWQDLACGTSDRLVAFASVTELIENPAVRTKLSTDAHAHMRCATYDMTALARCMQIPDAEKLRLVLLFALRYERDGKMQVGKMLESLGTDDTRNSVRTDPSKA